MADTSSGAPWSKAWEALNQQYWKAWTEQAAQGAQAAAGAMPGAMPGAIPGGAKMPWHEGLEQWSRLFAPPAGTQNEVVERMLAGARQFAQFAQAAQQPSGGTIPGATPQAWSEAFTRGLGAFGGLSAAQNPMLEAMRSIAGEGAMGFEQLAAQTQQMAGPFKHEMTAMLALPTFGYTREQQERTQAIAAAGVGYQEWNARYNALMLKASVRAVEIMESKLAERSEPGREITSMRGLYDLWVDAAEEGYAEVALSPEFRHVYGELVNAQMRMRKLFNAEVERNTQSLGIPTRTELDSVHKRLAEVRRQLARLEEALQGAVPADAEVGAATNGGDAPARRHARPAKRRAAAKPAAATAPRGEFAAQLAATRKAARNGNTPRK
jgi:class III poly(R)-hydroxyalkanoic acid synthase PhaE subunit